MVSSRKKKGMKRERNARTSRSDTYLCSPELHYRATLLNITSRTNTPHSGNNIPPWDTETDLRLPVLTAFSTALHFLLSRAKSTAIQITFVPLSVRKPNTSIVRFAIRELERSRKNRFATFRELSANSNIFFFFYSSWSPRYLHAVFARTTPEISSMVLFVLVSFISLFLGYSTRPDCERNTEDCDEREAEKHGTAPWLHLSCKFDHVTSRRVNGEYFSVFAKSSPEFASIDSFPSDLCSFSF